MNKPIKSTIKTIVIAITDTANTGVRSDGSRLRYALIAFPKPAPVSPVMISAIIVVLSDKAKLDANPTMIYGKAIGTLILNNGTRPPFVSILNISMISWGTLLIPPTMDSYRMGNAMRNTIYTGAYLEPLIAKNINTTAAVGKLLNTVIRGFMKIYTLLNEPAKRPNIIETSKAPRKPIKVL